MARARTGWLRLLRIFALACLALAGSGCSVVRVLQVWGTDPHSPLPPTKAGENDASRLYANTAEVVTVPGDLGKARSAISTTVARAIRERRSVSISGARHSMGGHTFTSGGLVLDMQEVDHLELDESRRILRAGAGARWAEVIPYLDKHGLSVSVMQSNSDFTVGGSLSVNCHGWQHDAPPISGSVESLTLVTADGSVRHCSRHENRELFSLALGGYGLFGVILEAELRVVPNTYYRARSEAIRSREYPATYRRMVSGASAGMAYGRLNTSPRRYLDASIITVLETCGDTRPVSDTLHDGTPWSRAIARMKRAVFRAGAGHPGNRDLRWKLETSIGENGTTPLSRNRIMHESSEWFANRDPRKAEILLEVFVPVDRLETFLTRARTLIPGYRSVDLLNVTVRNVKPDPDSFLRYARQEVFGLVMLFNHGVDAASEDAMARLDRALIDAALATGGSYYLPYRPHATPGQFRRAYPQWARFAELKHRHDPDGVFSNEFWRKYGR